MPRQTSANRRSYEIRLSVLILEVLTGSEQYASWIMVRRYGVVNAPKFLIFWLEAPLLHLLFEILKIDAICSKFNWHNSQARKLFHTVQGNHVCELIHKDITTEIDQYGEYEMQALCCACSDNQVLAYKEETDQLLYIQFIILLTCKQDFRTVRWKTWQFHCAPRRCHLLVHTGRASTDSPPSHVSVDDTRSLF